MKRILLSVEYDGTNYAGWQRQANGLAVTGEADADTLDRLNSPDALSRQGYLARFANAYAQMAPLEKGSTSNDVLSVQRKLKEWDLDK